MPGSCENYKFSYEILEIFISISEIKFFLLLQHDRLINLCSVGVDNFNIDELEIAITKILGKQMDHIIVDKTKDAVDCINFLKDKYRGGKYSAVETFIPLDNLKKIKKFNRA